MVKFYPAVYTIRIADDDDQPHPPNVLGNLLVRADLRNAFFEGYYKCPDQTLEAFSNLWFHTGDLAKVDEAGNVYFLGRVKDVIRRRGDNVNAFEVEEELLRHPHVVAVAAFAVPSLLGDGTEEEIKVAVVARENSITERGFNEKNC